MKNSLRFLILAITFLTCFSLCSCDNFSNRPNGNLTNSINDTVLNNNQSEQENNNTTDDETNNETSDNEIKKTFFALMFAQKIAMSNDFKATYSAFNQDKNDFILYNESTKDYEFDSRIFYFSSATNANVSGTMTSTENDLIIRIETYLETSEVTFFIVYKTENGDLAFSDGVIISSFGEELSLSSLDLNYQNIKITFEKNAI